MTDNILNERVQKWEPFVRRLIVALLALLLGVLLARLVWVYIEPGGAVSQTVTLPRYSVSNAAISKVAAETNLLTTLNPFDIDAASGEIIIEEAPETGLNLELVGSRATSNDSQASATIRTPDNVASVYKPGEEVIPGVVLEQVLADQQVLLRRNGVLESLRTKGRGDGFLVLTEDGEREQPQVSTETPAPSVPSGPFRVEDGRALFNSMSIQGVRDGNSIIGYRLSARDGGNLMRTAGLQPGDVLIGFDGDGIAELEPADVRDRLVNGAVITLSVERQGKTEVVTVAIGDR